MSPHRTASNLSRQAILPEDDAGPKVDPAGWFLSAKFAWGVLVLAVLAGVYGAVWVTNFSSRMGSIEKLLVKIDRQMMVPSQFNEWTYEMKAANPAMDLKVPKLPMKAADQYQGN